jgi:predicted O-methyltransferase YrrM
MGYKVCGNACSADYVRYRVSYSLPQLDAALKRDDVFWIHPIPRQYDNPLRKRVRDRWNHYESTHSPKEAKVNGESEAPRLLLTVPILQRMKRIEGWLDDAEADLLIAAVTRAVAVDPEANSVVEIGSYCGRSTVVLGSALNALGLPAEFKIYAIDPLDGVVGALDQGIKHTGPTLEKFRRNIAEAALAERVETVTKRSFEVAWDRPICFLFVDGLHDYANVARDFHHFERWIALGGYVAFHDYADYYPGVKTFVNELLALGHYEKVHQATSMIVLRKQAEAQVPSLRELKQAPTLAEPAPAVVSARPLVSCIMPTADRRELVPQAIKYFLRQDYAERELIVLDDGADVMADLMPSDSRIRYVRLDQRRTMGAKHNLACELANGDIIVHWDDDDWMADWRISYQVASLLAQPGDTLCGLSRLFFYDPRAARAWEYAYPDANRPWVIGSTFCYRRDFWDRHKHPDMNEGADTMFVWGLRGINVVAHPNRDFYVGLVHPGNTSPKRINGGGWQALPVERVRDLVKDDWNFYESWSRSPVLAR